MKIRAGFVSNSSSSSFVVAFPHKPKDKFELMSMLFTEGQTCLAAYDRGYPIAEVAETVWNDLKDQQPMLLAEMAGVLSSGYYPYELLEGQFSANDGSLRFDWEDFHCAQAQVGIEAAQEFREENPDAEVFTFNYADEDGSYFATLEHGDLFGRLPHVRISKH